MTTGKIFVKTYLIDREITDEIQDNGHVLFHRKYILCIGYYLKFIFCWIAKGLLKLVIELELYIVYSIKTTLFSLWNQINVFKQLLSTFSQNHKIQAGKQILKIDMKWLLYIFGKSCNCIVRNCTSIRIKLTMAFDFNRMCSRTFSFQNDCISQSLYSELLSVFVSAITIT